ncbi:MAG: dephospho-CoA kinase [Lautropia sp.]|nr:dephospho-CoA kinase [Lautropia sp.]
MPTHPSCPSDNTIPAPTARQTTDAADGRLLRIGLTGGIGSGKSLVAGQFVALGAALIDTDQLAHALTAPDGAAIETIRAQFGDAMIAADGSMDRSAMRALVFAQPEKRQQLQGILHPMVRQQVQDSLRQMAEQPVPPPYVLIAVPLLVESGHWQQRVHRVLVVDCPEDLQVQRVMKRSGLEAAQVRAIMATQATRQQRLAAASDVVDNSGSVEDTAAQVAALHRQYLQTAGK